MEIAQVEPFVGMSYSDQFDCADFAVFVARELFKKDVTLPGDRPRGEGCHAALADASKAYGVPTDTPQDGDIVLMYDIGDSEGSPSHVGIYIELKSLAFILHSGEKFGGSIMSRLDRLGRFGLHVEGYYKWLS